MREDHLAAFPSDRAVEQAIVVLKKGAHLLRYKRGKPKFCSFKLSADEKFLIWYSGQKEKQLKLSSVSRIIQGPSTKQLPAEKDTQCFSLICGSQRSLDLICKDKGQAETWILGLRAIISRNCGPKLLDSFRNQRGSQSCINSPAGFSRRKDILGLQEAAPLSQVLGLSQTPTRSISRRCFADGSSCTSDSFYTQSNMSSVKNIRDVFIPDSPYVGHDEENRGFKKNQKISTVTELPKLAHDSLLSGKHLLRDVLIWGEGVHGGYFGAGEIQSDSLLPRVLESAEMLDVQAIALARNYASLVTKQGEVFCWGEGKKGRLGHRIDMDSTCPKIVDSLIGVNVKHVACSEYQSCALTLDGEVYTWGDNGCTGEYLGQGRISPWLPHRLSGLLNGVTILHVACGEWHTAIVSTSGKLFTYGDGTFGVLGHGNLLSVSQPKEVDSLKGLRVKSVACGPWHTAAIVDIIVTRSKFNKPGGKLFTWGDGDKGRLGHSDQMRKLVPTCVSKLVDHDFVQVACGRLLTVGLSNMGKVFTIGSSVHGQLGNPQATDKSVTVVQGRLKDEFVKEISSGCFHVAALTSRGNVYTWGRGANGQLGVGDTQDRNSPTLVEALRDRQVLHITCGSSLTAAICSHKSLTTADQSTCKGCNTAFSFTRKKQNCYNCGLSFCRPCSSKKATNASLAPNRNKPFRVCNLCFNQLQSAPYSDGISKLSAMSPRPLLFLKKAFSDNKEEREDLNTTCRRTASTRNYSYDSTQCNKENFTKEEQQILGHHSHLLRGMPRWGQVSCPEMFRSGCAADNQTPNTRSTPFFPTSKICSHQIPVDLRVGSSPVKKSEEKFSQPNRCLAEEVNMLRDQVESLKKLCQQRRRRIQECEEKVEEAWNLAKDEASKSKAAKEIVRALTSRLHLMSQRVLLDKDGKDDPCMDLLQLTHSIGGSPKLQGSPEPVLNRQMEDQEANNPPCSSPTVFCNSLKSLSGRGEDPKLAENGEEMTPSRHHEWVEQYQPGVYITLTTTESGQKELKRVRFSRKRYNEKEAQRWWDENQSRVCQSYEIEGYK